MVDPAMTAAGRREGPVVDEGVVCFLLAIGMKLGESISPGIR